MRITEAPRSAENERAGIRYEFHMTERERDSKREANVGFCVACGAENQGVHPTAYGWPCDRCRDSRVSGMETLRMLEVLRVNDD